MKKTVLLLAGLALASLSFAPQATAQTSNVRVSESFVRAAPAGRGAAVYMSLQGGPDRLVGVTSDAAGQVELRETIVENGAMSTRPVGGMLINPGVATRLAPGGLHIMLLNLKRPLKDGESINVTLIFERAAKATVPVPVAQSSAAVRPNVAVPGLRTGNR